MVIIKGGYGDDKPPAIVVIIDGGYGNDKSPAIVVINYRWWKW